MQVTLLYYDKVHGALGKPLAPGERVVFGRGDRAGLQLSGDDIAEAHLAIENDGNIVWAHRLADSMAPVFLNEHLLEKSELSDGDIMLVGNAKVRVQIRNRTVAARRQPAPISLPTKSREAAHAISRELSTGLILYH